MWPCVCVLGGRGSVDFAAIYITCLAGSEVMHSLESDEEFSSLDIRCMKIMKHVVCFLLEFVPCCEQENILPERMDLHYSARWCSSDYAPINTPCKCVLMFVNLNKQDVDYHQNAFNLNFKQRSNTLYFPSRTSNQYISITLQQKPTISINIAWMSRPIH